MPPSLFEACSGHVRATVPPPDPAAWRTIEDPGRRLEAALRALYAYYERLEQLLDNIERDLPLVPAMHEVNAIRVRYVEEVRELLLQTWPARGRAKTRLRRALGHAIEFRTWQSLVRGQGCRTEEAVQLMLSFVRAAS